MGRVDFGSKIYHAKTAKETKRTGKPIINNRSEKNSNSLNQSELICTIFDDLQPAVKSAKEANI